MPRSHQAGADFGCLTVMPSLHHSGADAGGCSEIARGDDKQAHSGSLLAIAVSYETGHNIGQQVDVGL